MGFFIHTHATVHSHFIPMSCIPIPIPISSPKASYSHSHPQLWFLNAIMYINTLITNYGYASVKGFILLRAMDIAGTKTQLTPFSPSRWIATSFHFVSHSQVMYLLLFSASWLRCGVVTNFVNNYVVHDLLLTTFSHSWFGKGPVRPCLAETV